MLKTTIDPYSQLYKTLQHCFSNQDSILLCQKIISYNALSIAEKLLYDLKNFYIIQFDQNSESKHVFEVLLSSPDYSFSEQDKNILIRDLHVKFEPVDFFKKKHLSG
jgi:hypothetical protein